jgi:hypothetical protein
VLEKVGPLAQQLRANVVEHFADLYGQACLARHIAKVIPSSEEANALTFAEMLAKLIPSWEDVSAQASTSAP